MPLILAVIMAGVILFFAGKEDEPVGMVDLADVTIPTEDYTQFIEEMDDSSVPWVKFENEVAAQAALEADDIQAYALVPADYLSTGEVTLYHQGNTFDGISSDLAAYLRASLLAIGDESLQARLWQTPDAKFISLGSDDSPNPFSVIITFFIGFLFLIAIFSTAGFLIQAIVDEKENRTMEILITSLKPEELMVGKILGLVGLGFVQIAIWGALIVTGLLIAKSQIPQFPEFSVPMETAVIAIAWFVPFYVMIAALMTAIGVTVTAVSEGQQAASIISLLSMAPLYLTFVIIERPNSALSQALSLIPFSSPLTMLARTQVTHVSLGMLLLSWVILAGSAAMALFMVSKLLHFGMLRYGQKMSLREVVRVLRPSR
ncbi:MAG: ABC transporter permease, partial [Anaerolineae bacterium]